MPFTSSVALYLTYVLTAEVKVLFTELTQEVPPFSHIMFHVL